MYRKKDRSKQTQLQMLCIEDLVPENHMLREIEEAIDSPIVNGKRLARNIYANSEEECEIKLAELIREMKEELEIK